MLIVILKASFIFSASGDYYHVFSTKKMRYTKRVSVNNYKTSGQDAFNLTFVNC
jgi:hypothetical protein